MIINNHTGGQYVERKADPGVHNVQRAKIAGASEFTLILAAEHFLAEPTTAIPVRH